jgi:SAM-dependent methyltransferase
MSQGRADLSELLSAYEGLEAPESFPDPVALERYRTGLLARSRPQADFLVKHVQDKPHVLEIGCGNGRLLIELARRNAIGTGLGLDIARSRVDFARAWARDESCDQLEFAVADVLDWPLRPGAFGAVLCMTGVFAYFEPLAAGTASSLVRKLYEGLEPNGLVCLELYPHSAYRVLLEATGGQARIWSELPVDDPWRFYLSALSLDESGDVLTHEKTFIHRTNGRIDSGRRERIYLYSEERAREALTSARFREIRVYESWSGEPYGGGEVMVVTARK